MHGDRFAGYFTFGHNGSWWSDELGYAYHGAYTDATFGWLDGYIGNISHFNTSTDIGGDFENPLMNAIGKIMKGLYFSKFTDIFGELPYSEAGSRDSFTPKFDTQLEIYQGVITELNEAMATIGDETKTGEAINDIASNDIYYAGDLQK